VLVMRYFTERKHAGEESVHTKEINHD
jgi:multidrug efflux pump